MISNKRKSSAFSKKKLTILRKLIRICSVQQAEEAKIQKTNLQQGLIRKQFELDDIEGKLDDIASHLDQARQQNEEWIRKQTRAEAKKERSVSACVIYKVN